MKIYIGWTEYYDRPLNAWFSKEKALEELKRECIRNDEENHECTTTDYCRIDEYAIMDAT